MDEILAACEAIEAGSTPSGVGLQCERDAHFYDEMFRGWVRDEHWKMHEALPASRAPLFIEPTLLLRNSRSPKTTSSALRRLARATQSATTGGDGGRSPRVKLDQRT